MKGKRCLSTVFKSQTSLAFEVLIAESVQLIVLLNAMRAGDSVKRQRLSFSDRMKYRAKW